MAQFSRDRSRKDGRYPQCKGCVRRWHQKDAERLAEYNRRWRETNRDETRAWDRRYRSESEPTPATGSEGERRTAAIGGGKRARISGAPPESNDW